MVTAQQIFKELDESQWRPFYLIVGEEPFQAGEILARIKSFFIKGDMEASFCFEVFDGESLDVQQLVGSLQTLPGLFDDPQSTRLVLCHKIDKLSSGAWETLAPYFDDPSPSTCFLMTAAKVDKRKSWVKQAEARGALLEVSEPFERDWPRWRSYFERKAGKKIAENAWQRLVESADFSLSLVWTEIQKASVYVGEKSNILLEDVQALTSPGAESDVFEFTQDVVCKRQAGALRKYETLLRNGENEIKLLSLLVRHFRQVEGCFDLLGKGITDTRLTAQQIGVPPFFIPKIQNQARLHSAQSLKQAFHLLTEADYHLKIGAGTLFDRFLVPYFQIA